MLTNNHCARCGGVMNEGDAFCGSCGAARPVSPPQGPPPPPPAEADDERISRSAVAGALVGLLALAALLVGLSSSVHDQNAKAQATEIVAGKISVLGSARVRDWSVDPFSVQVPAGWRNIARGEARGAGPGFLVQAWAGSPRSQDAETACAAQDRSGTTGPCLYISVNQERVRGFFSSAAEAATRAASVNPVVGRPGYQLEDLGPITAGGSHWAWRWTYRADGARHIDYFFSTCRAGKQAAEWTVRTSAPEADYPEAEFGAVLSSLRTRDSGARRDSIAAPSSGASSSIGDRPDNCSAAG